MIRMRRACACAIGAALALAAACKSGPDYLTTRQTARATALAEAGVLAGKALGYGPVALSQINATGRLTLTSPAAGATVEFEAVAIVVYYDLRSIGTELDVGWFNGVVAWAGFDPSSSTAEQVSMVGAEGAGNGYLLTGEVEVGTYTENGGGLAQFFNRASNAYYIGTSGTYTVSTANVADNQPCRTEQAASAPPISCRYSVGTMTGAFSYTGESVSTPTTGTYTQPSVTFSLPAILVSLTS